MAYIGNTPGENFISFSKQVFTIVNSQTAYSLDHKVTDENELRLVINNVVQEPGTGKAYTASGNTLTLASALTNGTDEMYCIFLGKARETSTVPDSFITKNKLNLISTSSSAGLEVKGDGSSQYGYLQLNCSQNSHGVKIKSPPHSAGQSYTLTLPQSISADTFLKTDGSGNLSFAAAGGTNTPLVAVRASTGPNIPSGTNTKIPLDTEMIDTDNTFDSSTNYRWSPGVAGKYYMTGTVSLNINVAGKYIQSLIYKNGSMASYQQQLTEGTNGTYTVTVDLLDDNDGDDYYELYIRQNTGGNVGLNHSATALYTRFFGYKLLT